MDTHDCGAAKLVSSPDGLEMRLLQNKHVTLYDNYLLLLVSHA